MCNPSGLSLVPPSDVKGVQGHSVNICGEEKDQVPIKDLSTWIPDQNCTECRWPHYLLQDADNPSVPL